MAITPDSINGTISVANATSITFPHTVGTGNFLIVGVSCPNVTNPSFVTGAKYNNVNMTSYMAISGAGILIYGLVAPAAGTNNVVFTLTGSAVINATSSSWNNVSQTGPVRNAGASTSGSANPGDRSVSVTTVAGDVVVDAAMMKKLYSTPPVLTVGASQTQMALLNGATYCMGMSYRLATGTPTVMTWNVYNYDQYKIGAIPLVPEAVASGGIPGVGGLFLGKTGGLIR
jgi:hypothetical protein